MLDRIKRDVGFQEQANKLWGYEKDDNSTLMASRNITFQVTDDCSLRCTYCYQINKSTRRMKLDTAKAFIDTLIRQDDGSVQSVVIEFIGGEPFLEIDLIVDIMNYWNEALLEANHRWLSRYMISICSNGLHNSNPKVQKFLKDYQPILSFTISIDGNKELHDSARIQPNGKGSYDIAHASKEEYRKNFNRDTGTKITIAPSNLPFLYVAIKQYIEKDHATEIYANCIYEEGWTYEDGAFFYKELKRLSNYIIDNGYYNLYLSLFEEDSFRPIPEEENNNWCGGDGKMLALDPDGYLYPCIRYMESSLGTDQKPLRCGDAWNGIDEEALADMRTITRRSQSTDECFNCPIGQGCSWCFPAGTRITTPDGYKNIEELNVNDRVIDIYGNVQTVTQNMSRVANKESLLTIKAGGIIPTTTTAEHPFWGKPFIGVKRINGKQQNAYGAAQWIKAGDLKQSDRIGIFTPKIGSTQFDVNLAYIAGRYLGDGWKTSSQRQKTPYKYYICCSFEEYEDMKIKLDLANITYRVTKNRTVYEFALHTSSEKEQILITLLDQMGRYAYDKKVPTEIFEWSKDSLEAFLTGYFDADGYCNLNTKSQSFTTVSEELLYGVCMLVRMVYNKNPNITITPSGTSVIENRIVNNRQSYQARFLLETPKRKFYEFDTETNIMWSNITAIKTNFTNDETVYNLSISNSETFIANDILVHNCSAYNYQVFGTINKRATFICPMHKARALANVYYWNTLYRKLGMEERFINHCPDEWALQIVDENELQMLKELAAQD